MKQIMVFTPVPRPEMDSRPYSCVGGVGMSGIGHRN